MICKTCQEAGNLNKDAGNIGISKLKKKVQKQAEQLHGECPSFTWCDCAHASGLYVVP
jgi:UDP-N-acetylmuramoylalanine-D-glutamate ligase